MAQEKIGLTVRNLAASVKTVYDETIPVGGSKIVYVPRNPADAAWTAIKTQVLSGEIEVLGSDQGEGGLAGIALSTQATLLDATAPPVQDATELAALAGTEHPDKQTRLVEDLGAIFRYDSSSTATPAVGEVIQPDDISGAGRWIKSFAQPSAHAADHATGGGDELTPADIGAAAETHASEHATGGGDPLTASDIGAASETHAADHDPDGSDALSTKFTTHRTNLSRAADALAADVQAETPFFRADKACTLVSVQFTGADALTADDTDNATLTIRQRDGIGGSATTVATLTTNLAGGGLTAFVTKSLGALTNAAMAVGAILTLEVTKAGAGVVIPAGVLSVDFTVS